QRKARSARPRRADSGCTPARGGCAGGRRRRGRGRGRPGRGGRWPRGGRLGESSEHALVLIEKIVQEASCPVILLIHEANPGFVREASKRGIFAYITDGDDEDAPEWQSSIDIVLRRFTEYHDLEGAFGRRAVTERAKGILMERHSVGE